MSWGRHRGLPHRESPPMKEIAVPLVENISFGSPCWVELFTSDVEKATTFYGELFGWTAEPANPDFGGYFNFSKNSQVIAGCMANDGSSGPDMWSTYLKVADARATASAAEANGARIHVPAMDVGDLGTMAVMADPCGAAI